MGPETLHFVSLSYVERQTQDPGSWKWDLEFGTLKLELETQDPYHRWETRQRTIISWSLELWIWLIYTLMLAKPVLLASSSWIKFIIKTSFIIVRQLFHLLTLYLLWLLHFRIIMSFIIFQCALYNFCLDRLVM